MLSHGSSHPLLVGMQTGVATWGENLALFSRVKEMRLCFKEWTPEQGFWSFDVHADHLGNLVGRQCQPQEVWVSPESPRTSVRVFPNILSGTAGGDTG